LEGLAAALGSEEGDVMAQIPLYFSGTPPGLGLGHVYTELAPTGEIVRAWTAQTTEIDRSHWPALQAWVDEELAGR
jgi:hypothetical protein